MLRRSNTVLRRKSWLLIVLFHMILFSACAPQSGSQKTPAQPLLANGAARQQEATSTPSELVMPRQWKRVVGKLLRVTNVERRRQCRFLADLVWSDDLRDFQHLCLIGLEIGQRHRTVRRPEVDAEAETRAHLSNISFCIVARYWRAGFGFTSGPWRPMNPAPAQASLTGAPRSPA